MSPLDLSGRRVLITGGSRGIGRATAVLFASSGADVGITFHRAADQADETLRRVRDAGSGHSWFVAADLATEVGVQTVFERVDVEFGGLDVFVGNAGVWNEGSRAIGDLELSDWSEMLDTNLTSVFLTTREAVKRMGPNGRIILVSSTAAQRGEAFHSHYAASKGAINAFVKSVAVELGPRDITVNAVAPGWVDTDMSASVLRSERRPSIEAEIPLRRIATAEDVAGPILFLASDLARHVTGEVLNVNGGSVLCG